MNMRIGESEEMRLPVIDRRFEAAASRTNLGTACTSAGLSGLIFARSMAKHAAGKDLANPYIFFTLAHSLGWGTKNPDYMSLVTGAYRLLRNSARASEQHT